MADFLDNGEGVNMHKPRDASMEIFRRVFSKVTVLVVCAPLLMEKVDSGNRPRGCFLACCAVCCSFSLSALGQILGGIPLVTVAPAPSRGQSPTLSGAPEASRFSASWRQNYRLLRSPESALWPPTCIEGKGYALMAPIIHTTVHGFLMGSHGSSQMGSHGTYPMWDSMGILWNPMGYIPYEIPMHTTWDQNVSHDLPWHQIVSDGVRMTGIDELCFSEADVWFCFGCSTSGWADWPCGASVVSALHE